MPQVIAHGYISIRWKKKDSKWLKFKKKSD
jgi:hypothetical protein